jgi:hypothetical protein
MTARATATPAGHVVLLGDSIFDNAAHVPGGPDVVTQLRARLPPGWRATLAAVDGAVIGTVERQLGRLPTDATHLVLSVGGNDALGHSDVLDAAARSIADALDRLAHIRESFWRDYRAMLASLLARRLPTALCTIYDGRLPDPSYARLATTALTLFNDCITREAFAHGLPLVDLRLLFDQDADYANPIEPSAQGGAKLAAAIVALLAEHDFSRHRSGVFARPAP